MKRSACVLALALACAACGGGPLDAPEVTVYVHSSRALPAGLDATLGAAGGVRWTRTATTAMVSLVHVEGGTALRRRPADSILPFSIAAAEPLPDPDDRVSVVLSRGEAVLPSASAAVRGLAPGGHFTLALGTERQTLEVGAVIDDPRTVEVEALVPMWAARNLGISSIRDVVVRVRRSHLPQLTSAASDLAAPAPVRVGDRLEDISTPKAGQILSLGDIKRRFGEFSFFRMPGTRWLEPDPAWVAANIVETDVALLGRMKCNRAILAPLERAVAELTAAGLGGLVTEPASCYAPRFSVADPSVISRHAWGIAVDINASANRFGERPAQDARLVEIMRRAGFAWGGVWLVPDGMHFEYTGETAA